MLDLHFVIIFFLLFALLRIKFIQCCFISWSGEGITKCVWCIFMDKEMGGEGGSKEMHPFFCKISHIGPSTFDPHGFFIEEGLVGGTQNLNYFKMGTVSEKC